ncbi:thiol reductant ABC exporter subunit CydD [Jiangella ureilytica]|uniref:Thiol reductant ABC exporter subunit CydD n=1 Tax=Jiangella ureilytica TaxID=2530374 RepID=A0A4R4RCD1_9ACTN|nr:thiol reductant ABC exporter subunit CydD [Jiangella ureilytica]
MNQLARRLLAGLPAFPVVAAAFTLLAVAGAVVILVQAELLARLLADGVLDGPSVGSVAAMFGLLAGVFAVRAGLSWAQQALAQRAAASVKASLRRRVLRRTQELGPGWLSGQHTGGLTTTLGRGLDALDPWFTGYFPQLFVAAVVPVAVLVRIAVADLASAVIIVVTLPLIPIFGILVGLSTTRATERQWRALERLGGHFLDVVAGLPTLRAFGRATSQAQAVRRIADEHRSATMRTLRIAFLSALVLELVATLSVALVAVPVGLRTLDGGLTLSTALLVLLLAPEAYLPLRALGSQFHASTEGLAVAERCFEVLDAPGSRGPARSLRRPDATSAGGDDGAATPTPAPGSGRSARVPVASGADPAAPVVRFEDVTVRYAGREEAALDGVSLSVATGERVALVGPSGAGKSTLLNVLLGLVPVSSGRVLVGGVDLADADVEEWRREVAWVPQRPHLFARTVAENIRLGRPDATDDEVVRAARLAHADEFVAALPRGYETALGERGAGLSSGQRQRIALARAFLRDAPLLVLDEPTAGLDAGSEATVVEATARLMAGRTVLVVAHRPAMVLDAGRVVTIEHGRIAGPQLPAGVR